VTKAWEAYETRNQQTLDKITTKMEPAMNACSSNANFQSAIRQM
jgi:hypothetical protein